MPTRTRGEADVIEVGGMHRERMSYEEWQALPENPKAEWVDGWAVWSLMPPTFAHGRSQAKLAIYFDRVLPQLFGCVETLYRVAPHKVRLPDFMLLTDETDAPEIEGEVVILVEVLSPSTQGQDTVVKSDEYLRAGVRQYWLLDPDARTLAVYDSSTGGWDEVLLLSEETPTGTVAVGAYGRIEVDLRELLPQVRPEATS